METFSVRLYKLLFMTIHEFTVWTLVLYVLCGRINKARNPAKIMNYHGSSACIRSYTMEMPRFAEIVL